MNMSETLKIVLVVLGVVILARIVDEILLRVTKKKPIDKSERLDDDR